MQQLLIPKTELIFILSSSYSGKEYFEKNYSRTHKLFLIKNKPTTEILEELVTELEAVKIH
jgi:hypothetical protein